MTPQLDVLIVGAGISGIGAAYHLQTKCPGKSFAILDMRESIGGTWDLFRYPGIRSDSDMYTLGFSFRPWKDPKAIADGGSILEYLKETAAEHGIDRKVRFGKKVIGASWSGQDACWTVRVLDTKTHAVETLTAGFLFVCAGYYDYEAGYSPVFPGAERFRGRIVHPQKWTEDVEYADRRVVVIGSGATAVTLVPTLARRAKHVTMLQRSPTWIISVPGEDRLANAIRGRLPERGVYELTRWKNVLLGMLFFNLSKKAPARMRRFLLAGVRRGLGEDFDVSKHFTPSYDPWDQRVCLVPDGDLFKALASGRAEVVTDHIETFTETGIRLKSGAELEADLIVTATGLNLKFLGGLALEVDGKSVVPSETLLYKGMMLSDVPNLAFAIGYTNASWTLKCDLTSEYVCRLLRHMDANGFRVCRPVQADPGIQPEPLMTFSSGYVQRSIGAFPRQGSARPWKLHQNYALDLVEFRRGSVADGVMQFAPGP